MSDTKKRVQALNDALHETFDLYRLTHIAHWNVRGPLFPQLHAMFDQQYNELWAALDVIAERVRALGSPVDPAAFTGEEQDIPADNRKLLSSLAKAHRSLSKSLGAIEGEATKAGDAATADLAIERIRAHDQHAWMLEAAAEP